MKNWTEPQWFTFIYVVGSIIAIAGFIFYNGGYLPQKALADGLRQSYQSCQDNLTRWNALEGCLMTTSSKYLSEDAYDALLEKCIVDNAPAPWPIDTGNDPNF